MHLFGAICKNPLYVLDWYHLHGNVCRTFRHTFPEDNLLRRKLRRPVVSCLWKGDKQQGLKELKGLHAKLLSEGKIELLEGQEGLGRLIEYIENNWEGIVNYQKMQKDGYLIASSLVEKAADLLIAKRQKKKQGMHWSKKGANNISALRTLWFNEDWENHWEQKYKKAA